jgi:hypothetical protein
MTDDIASVLSQGFSIKPGHRNLVALSAIKINSDDDIRDIDPFKRNCLFPDETDHIKLFKQYSQANCFFECSLLHGQNAIKILNITDQVLLSVDAN